MKLVHRSTLISLFKILKDGLKSVKVLSIRGSGNPNYIYFTPVRDTYIQPIKTPSIVLDHKLLQDYLRYFINTNNSFGPGQAKTLKSGHLDNLEKVCQCQYTYYSDELKKFFSSLSPEDRKVYQAEDQEKLDKFPCYIRDRQQIIDLIRKQQDTIVSQLPESNSLEIVSDICDGGAEIGVLTDTIDIYRYLVEVNLPARQFITPKDRREIEEAFDGEPLDSIYQDLDYLNQLDEYQINYYDPTPKPTRTGQKMSIMAMARAKALANKAKKETQTPKSH